MRGLLRCTSLVLPLTHPSGPLALLSALSVRAPVSSDCLQFLQWCKLTGQLQSCDSLPPYHLRWGCTTAAPRMSQELQASEMPEWCPNSCLLCTKGFTAKRNSGCRWDREVLFGLVCPFSRWNSLGEHQRVSSSDGPRSPSKNVKRTWQKVGTMLTDTLRNIMAMKPLSSGHCLCCYLHQDLHWPLGGYKQRGTLIKQIFQNILPQQVGSNEV